MKSCEMYRHNVPSLVVEKHHVVPESWWARAGVPVNTSFAMLCPTCHMNTHWAMDRIIALDAVSCAGVPPRALFLALRGIRLGRAAGLTPRRTL